MDKDILERSQKRVEEIQAMVLEEYKKRLGEIQSVLDENKMVLDAGIGTTIPYETMYEQFRKELGEAQTELEELQGPVDMMDVYLANGGESYSDAREEFLVNEYAKRKTKDYITPNQELNYANLLNEIVEIRQERREEKIESLMQRIEQTQDLEARVKKVEEAQNRKTELMTDLQAEQDRIRAQIGETETIKEPINREIGKIERAIEATTKYINSMKDEKDLPKEIFRTAVDKKIECVKKAEEQRKYAKKWADEIARLEGEYRDIDELLAQIDGRKENGLPTLKEKIAHEEELRKYCREAFTYYKGRDGVTPARIMNDSKYIVLKNVFAEAFLEKIDAKIMRELISRSNENWHEEYHARELLNIMDQKVINELNKLQAIFEKHGIDTESIHFDDEGLQYEMKEKVAEEVTKQEDEMWAEYEKLAQEKSKLEEDKDYVMNAEMELHNGEEKAEEEKVQKATEKEIRDYGDTGINSEIGTEGLPLGPYRVPLKEKVQQPNEDKSTVTTFPKAKPNVQPQQNTEKPTSNTTSQKKEQSANLILNTNGPYEIRKAGLHISDSGIPTYYVEVVDKDGKLETVNYEKNNGFYKIIVPGKEQEPELQDLQGKLIANPKKYYDFGLAGLLKEVDKNYRTKGEKGYIKMLMDKDLQAGERYKPFDIDYDLTKLGEVSIDQEDKAKVNYLKSLAKANAKAGLATYEKAPGIFDKIANFVKGLMEKITTKKLKPGTQDNQAPKKPTPEEIVDKYKASWKDKDFDIEKFIKDCQMTPEEADSMRKIHKNRINNTQFREDLAKKAKQSTGVMGLSEEEKLCECYRDLYKPGFDASKLPGLTPAEAQIIQADFEKRMNEQTALANFHSKNRKIKNGPMKFIKSLKGKVLSNQRGKSNYIGAKTSPSKVYRGSER